MSDRKSLTHYEQMLDAQSQCVPCKLCGGKALITDAGPGYGYYIECENGGKSRRKSQGCLINERQLGGWAYNVMDWWNRLHATPALYTPTTPDEDETRTAIAFYKAVKGYSYPDGQEVRARVHATGWDVYDPDKWPCDRPSEGEGLPTDCTYAVQHNPNCPSPFLVRLPRGVIDFAPPHQTSDALGYGKTFAEAFDAARSLKGER